MKKSAKMMSYCIRCRGFLHVDFDEFMQESAWCPRCKVVTAVSLCKVPTWVFGAILVLLLRSLYAG